ncbi:winged helix-turn-helix transcriptional regulator [Candidatus Micrarchaeota archaeon]|nr:winged helix-turn-helix transcriptional regulator [Candidatus Micrarchaeota archaeon]
MLDSTDMRTIHILLDNAKVSLAEIGKELGISQPAARKRIQKLKDKGVLRGSTILLNERRIGWERALLALEVSKSNYLKTLDAIQSTPMVTAVYTATGPYSLAVEVLGPVGIIKQVTKHISKIKGVKELFPITFVEKIK